MSRHRARSRRNLRLAQFSAVGLLALAGLLAAMPPQTPAPPAAPLPPPGTTPAGVEEPGKQALDLDPVLDVMDRLVKRTEVAAVTPPEPEANPDDGIEPEPGPEEPAADDWPHFRFVGSVVSARSYAFIIDHDGVSRTLRQGEHLGDYVVLGISSEKMVVSNCDDTERREYLIVERPAEQPAESVVDMGNVVGINAPAMNPKTGVDSPGNYVPGSDEQFDPEKARLTKLREYEEMRRNAAQRPGAVNPPSRTRPSTPAQPNTPDKNAANNKDVK